jgi:octaprenyl-diphosphate synthase
MAAILSEATNTICEGELLQVGDRFRIIGEPRYLEIIEKKTAVLYAVSCQIGGVLGGLSPAKCRCLRQFGMDLGRAFQIVDDCLDYVGEERVAGKSLGSDLRQGKITLPLIHLLEGVGDAERATLRDLLAAPLSPEQQAWMRARVIDEGAADAALERAAGYVQSARNRLAETFDAKVPSPIWERLDLLAEYILRRRR